METVLIQVPADADYLAVVRSASAHIATRLGCTLAEVADLRLAVDEACGLLLRHTHQDQDQDHDRQPGADDGVGAGDLECRFLLDGSALHVVVSRRARHTAPPQSDEFGWTILGALVDDIIWRVEGPTVHVELLKRSRADG